jgi:hypothetical protein
MSASDLVRAWREPENASRLNAESFWHPSGVVNLKDEDFVSNPQCSITYPCSVGRTEQYQCCV